MSVGSGKREGGGRRRQVLSSGEARVCDVDPTRGGVGPTEGLSHGHGRRFRATVVNVKYFCDTSTSTLDASVARFFRVGH